MNKKKFTVLALLMVVILTLTTCLFVACNPDNSDDGTNKEIKATEGLLINNSDFKVVDTSVKTYPRSLTSWTGAKMYSTSTFRDDVTAGIINLEQSLYNANKSKWEDVDDVIREKLLAGGRYGSDDEIKNALMIYMPEETTNSNGNKIHGATAYGYTSTSFTLDKGSYYKLTVDVLTYDIAGEKDDKGNPVEGSQPGARIYVSSNTYAEFAGIDTKGEWKTYTIYIETAPAATTSLTLQLGLGKYQSYFTKGLTTGYAFFDNVLLEKIEEDGSEKFADALEQEKTDGGVATATLKVPNGRFEFGSTTISSSGAPSSWTLTPGNSGKDDPAPSSLGYNAVIDLSKFADNYTKYSSTYHTRSGDNSTNTEYIPAKNLSNIVDLITAYEGRVGNNAFMLSQQLMTAQGIKSSRTITIEKNKIYKLSVQLYTYAIHGAGVSLILTGSDGKDIVIKGISSAPSDNVFIGSTIIDPDNKGYTSGEDTGASTNGWTTYSFYIQGNQFKDYSYNMNIWLGTEGTNSNKQVKYHSYTSNSDNATTYRANGTFSNGWVFIDDLALDEISVLPEADAGVGIMGANENQTLDCAVSGNNYTSLLVDLTTDNLFGEGEDYMLDNASGKTSLDGINAIGSGAPKGWKSNFDVTDESNPVIADNSGESFISEGIVDLTSESTFKTAVGDAHVYPGLPYNTVSKNAYMMHSAKVGYFEVDTDTLTIKANQFYRISLWLKTTDVSATSGAYVYLVDKSAEEEANLTSFTKINTKDYDEYLNDWCEITMVIRGASDKDTDVALRFTLGTGNRFAASTLTSGALFITNMNMSTITYANFNDTKTSTYVKSVDMSESYTYTFTNGNFDDYDLDDENLADGKPLKEQDVAATPDEWTINDNTLDINGKNDSTLFAGVIALTPDEDRLHFSTSHQAETATGISSDIFNNFYDVDNYSEEYLNSLGGPNMLAIGSKDDKSYAAGFASASVTLSANTYYSLSVYVKTVGKTTASVFLTGESSATGENAFIIQQTASNGDWTKYTFYIEVGNASVSVKLNLWLGRDVKYMNVEGDGEEEKEENAKSSGAVFFDNINYQTIDEETYNESADIESNKKISFLTDSFDSLSSTIESRSSLTTPNGWTGAADTNQSTSNTKSGIAYADSDYYETEMVDGTLYARLLGVDYKIEDVKITDEELEEAKESGNYEDMEDSDIIAALKEKKVLDQKKENWIPVSELKAFSGNRMLVINNTVKSAYRYTSSSNTLKENSWYRVSVYVRTYGLIGEDDDDTIGANVELYLGSANESDNPFIFKAINTQKPETEVSPASNEWTRYEFYVKTLDDDITSVTIKLSLGSYSSNNIDGEDVVKGLTSGYAMFDDVTIEKIDEDTFEKVEESDTVLKRTVAAYQPGDSNDPGENDTPNNKFNLDYLWWMIPTIVIGLVIIIVVIVLVVRKVRKNMVGNKKKVKKSNAPTRSEAIDHKHSRYDEGKE